MYYGRYKNRSIYKAYQRLAEASYEFEGQPMVKGMYGLTTIDLEICRLLNWIDKDDKATQSFSDLYDYEVMCDDEYEIHEDYCHTHPFERVWENEIMLICQD